MHAEMGDIQHCTYQSAGSLAANAAWSICAVYQSLRAESLDPSLASSLDMYYSPSVCGLNQNFCPSEICTDTALTTVAIPALPHLSMTSPSMRPPNAASLATMLYCSVGLSDPSVMAVDAQAMTAALDRELSKDCELK